MTITIQRGPAPKVVGIKNGSVETSELLVVLQDFKAGDWFVWDVDNRKALKAMAYARSKGHKLSWYRTVIDGALKIVVCHPDTRTTADAEKPAPEKVPAATRVKVETGGGVQPAAPAAAAPVKAKKIVEPAKATVTPSAPRGDSAEVPDDKLQQRILVALGDHGRRMSTKEMLEALERSNWPGAAVAALCDEGLVVVSSDGPGKTYYRLTPRGDDAYAMAKS